MPLHEISITNHAGYPWFKWRSTTTPTSIVNIIRYTVYPTFSLRDEKTRFELECGYMAAMSLTARNQGSEIISMKKRPLSLDDIRAEGSEQDIIFEITVDSYLNEANLSYRMARVSENILFKERKVLESKEITEEEESQIIEIFSDTCLTNIINKKMSNILENISNALRNQNGNAILGVGLLSSSYKVLFYKGLKEFKELTESEQKELGLFPSNEQELGKILNITRMPDNIDPEKPKNLYPLDAKYNFIIYNFNIGPKILGFVEPFMLIVGVKSKFSYESTLNEIIKSIKPYLEE